jgi:hypothetical protein
LLWRAPLADIPLERDEGEYAYTAQRWLKGGIPYQDNFDQKPPGVFMAYAVFLWIGGVSPAAIHWGAQLYTLAAITVVFLLGRKLFSAPAGLLAATLLAFMTTHPSVFGNAANTETFLMLPTTAAFLTALRAVERDSLTWGFLTGLLGGVGLLFKQIALFSLLFTAALLLWGCRRRLSQVAALGLGVLVVLGAVCAAFAFAGAWHEFYDCVIGHNLSWAGRIPLALYPAVFWSQFRGVVVAFWPVFVFALAGCLPLLHGEDKPRRSSSGLVVLWLLFCCAGAATGGAFYPHYFIPALPAVALLAGFGMTLVFPPGRSAIRGALPYLACAGVIGYALWVELPIYSPGSHEAKCAHIYGSDTFQHSRAVADLVASLTQPDDPVFILGSEPQILVYAQRRSASRYKVVYPLLANFRETRARQQGVLHELEASPPEIMIAVFRPNSLILDPDAPRDLFQEVLQRLRDSYQVVAYLPWNAGQARPLVTGAEAAKMWEQSPLWYDTPIPRWASLIVWKRRS